MAIPGNNVFSGFLSFPFKINKDSTVNRILFIKQHKTREGNEFKPQDRTLFVVNVPPYMNEMFFQELFKPYGNVEKVYFHQKPTATQSVDDSKCSKYFSTKEAIKGYKVAYVVFQKAAGLNKILQSKSEVSGTISTEQFQFPVGVKKWCRQYNEALPDVIAMSEEIEKYMNDYDRRVEKEKEKAKQMDGVVDEEGWITVTKHSRKPAISRTAGPKRKLYAMLAQNKKKELVNFYSFQIRETKMERLAQLRKKFEEDKERIAVMKAHRKFKPY